MSLVLRAAETILTNDSHTEFEVMGGYFSPVSDVG